MGTQKQYNELFTSSSVASASPFHSIVWEDVFISTNPNDKEVYKNGGAGYGDDYVPYYTPTKVAITKLMNAAGIQITENSRVDNRLDPYVVEWHCKGKWVMPDMTERYADGDYCLDLRDNIPVGEKVVRGARFQQEYDKERDTLIEKRCGLKLKGNEKDKQMERERAYRALDDDKKIELEQDAEARSLRTIVGMRQHIVQRAQSGAMLRVARELTGLKGQYTADELKLPFRIPRSRFDFDAMQKQVGSQFAGELAQAQAMKLLGISPDDLSRLRQIAAPSSMSNKSTSPIAPVQDEEQVEGEETEPEKKDDKGNSSGSLGTPSGEYTKGVLRYQDDEHTPTKVMVNGTWREASAESKLNGRASDWMLEKWFKSVRLHMDNHIKKHFGKGTVAAMTWEEVAAMYSHFQDGKDDDRWYKTIGVVDTLGDQEAKIAKAFGLDMKTADAQQFVSYCMMAPDPMFVLRWAGNTGKFEEISQLANLVGSGAVEVGTQEYEQVVKDAGLA